MTNTKIILALLVMTIVLMVSLRIQNQQLITPAAPLGILSLEFSTSASQIDQIRAEWVGETRQAFYVNTALDYFYLLVYGIFLFFTCRYLAILRPGGSRIGVYAALCGLTAAGLDAVENLLMMASIQFGGSNLVATATAVMASTKFFLAALALIYILVAGTTRLLQQARKKGVVES